MDTHPQIGQASLESCARPLRFTLHCSQSHATLRFVLDIFKESWKRRFEKFNYLLSHLHLYLWHLPEHLSTLLKKKCKFRVLRRTLLILFSLAYGSCSTTALQKRQWYNTTWVWESLPLCACLCIVWKTWDTTHRRCDSRQADKVLGRSNFIRITI